MKNDDVAGTPKALDSAEGVDCFLDEMMGLMRFNFESHGCLEPVCMMIIHRLPGTGDELPFPEPVVFSAKKFMTGPEGKDALADIIKELVKATKASTVLLATEMWLADLSLEDPAKAAEATALASHGELSKFAGRREAVGVMVESKQWTPHQRMYEATIERDTPDGPPRLLPFHLMDDKAVPEGRFFGFLEG
jgi:hypothetical protein